MLLALALRELRRRTVRSTLTILGIAIGVAALVLLGALSEKMGRLVAGGRDFATGQITVSGAGTGALTGMTRGGLLSGEQLEAVRAVPGVDAVAPIVMFPLSDTPASLPFTMSPLVFGVDLDALVRNHANRHVPPPAVHAGRLVPAPGSDEIVLGSEVARLYGATVGTTLTIRGRAFHVIGVLDPTLTGPDSLVFMPFETAERLLVDSEPLLRHLLLVPGARVLPIATAAAVFWATGADPSAVAARIAATVPGLTVLSPAEAARQVDRALAVLDGLIVGSAVVALLVASLAVANTMFTAVVERRREIGIKRAVGATRRQVIHQLLAEAVVLGVAGSLLGLAGGAAGVLGLNSLTAHLGATAFLITTRLVVAAATLPAALAALAGLWPAWRAARLPPSDAIRWA
jgi:putative ABC transport system permease protein